MTIVVPFLKRAKTSNAGPPRRFFTEWAARAGQPGELRARRTAMVAAAIEGRGSGNDDFNGALQEGPRALQDDRPTKPPALSSARRAPILSEPKAARQH